MLTFENHSPFRCVVLARRLTDIQVKLLGIYSYTVTRCTVVVAYLLAIHCALFPYCRIITSWRLLAKLNLAICWIVHNEEGYIGIGRMSDIYQWIFANGIINVVQFFLIRWGFVEHVKQQERASWFKTVCTVETSFSI